MKGKIAIAVVTKDRPDKLVECLKSIQTQTIRVDQLIIVDGSKSLSAKDICTKLDFPNTIYLSRPNILVPDLRNIALEHCDTQLLGFVDDDCVLDKGWVKKGLETFNSEKVGFVLGRSSLLNKKNWIAQAQHVRDLYWKNQVINSEKIDVTALFDTKNVIIDCGYFKKKGIKFDHEAVIGIFDSADFEMGLKLKKMKVKGIYIESMRLLHCETTNLTRFGRRAYYRGKLGRRINKKYNYQLQLVEEPLGSTFVFIKERLKHFSRDYLKYLNHHQDNQLTKIGIFLLINFHDFCYIKGYFSE